MQRQHVYTNVSFLDLLCPTKGIPRFASLLKPIGVENSNFFLLAGLAKKEIKFGHLLSREEFSSSNKHPAIMGLCWRVIDEDQDGAQSKRR